MVELIEYLQYPWIIRAMVASVIVGITCGVLGVFIVLRNMALIGDALSHAILPGVVLAFLIFGSYHLPGFFAGAVMAGLIAAAAITWIQQKLPTKNDAAIGIIFTVMFAIGVIGISILSRNEGVHLDLNDFLFGNVLGVSQQDLYLNVLIILAVVASIVIFYRYFYISTFQESFAKALGINTSLVHYYLMLLLSFTVVASLQTVGVILVVAMLITPASTAILWSDRLKKILFISSFFGALSAISGLVLAILLEMPPGPSMAVAAFIFYLFSALFAPQKGVLAAYFKKRKYRRQVIEEDLLKYLFKYSQKKEISAIVLSEELGIPTIKAEHYLSQMKKRGLLKLKTKDYWKCTEKGMRKGAKLVRAHRLWETWLVANTGLKEDQIHEDAELYEHILDSDIIDHIDAALGFPEKDPHGEYIPQIYSRKTIEIKELNKGDRFILSGEEEWQSALEQKSGISLINRVLIVSSHEGTKIVFQRRNLPEKYDVTINPGFTVLHLSPKKIELPGQV